MRVKSTAKWQNTGLAYTRLHARTRAKMREGSEKPQLVKDWLLSLVT